jgi:hypothetical protein
MLTMLPAKSPPAGLPMSLILHGLRGNARHAAPTGLLKQLSSDGARGAGRGARGAGRGARGAGRGARGQHTAS